MKEVVKESGAKRKKSLPRKRRTVKRQKLEEDAEKEELKGFLDIIPREDVAEDVESLSTKYPIVDWKTYTLTENFMYYQILKRWQFQELKDYGSWDDIEMEPIKPVAKTTTNADGTSTTLIPCPITTKEKVQKKNDMKARNRSHCKGSQRPKKQKKETGTGIKTALEELNGPKTRKNVNEDTSNRSRESPDSPWLRIADCNYHQRERVVSENNYTRVNYNYSAKQAHPSAHKNMVPRAVLMKTGLRSLNTDRPVNTAHPKTTVYSARPMPKVVNTARPNSVVVNAVRANQGTCPISQTSRNLIEDMLPLGEEPKEGKLLVKELLKVLDKDVDEIKTDRKKGVN
ncbi:hypothetical protein Tco_0938871 [Tanacetum coccineum]|uniref:Uncharacterized protein n=1 Tax=Tanacetum coccineum TaxID=301880 RepID=A0ABQ5DIF8_9ASTR